MIPLQVRMKGWMRYRDEQVADFRGGSLISICGENGAGKSAIFDAITYALYGKHRLGQQATEELINQDSDVSTVEFDFEVAGQAWRVHRGKSKGTLSRTGRPVAGATTQSLFRWDATAEQWVLVPGTDSALKLQAAVDGIILMSEAAFTSSFLLRQGDATQFLDARPGKRFETVSSLIGLAEYERLADAARRASAHERSRAVDIHRDLLPLAEVSPEAVLEQHRLNEAAQSSLVGANEALTQGRARARDAERLDLRLREIDALTAQIDAAAALIARKGQIEADAARFETLATTIDALRRLAGELEQAQSLEAEAEQARLEATAIDIEALEVAVAAARKSVSAASMRLTAAAAALTEAGAAEREADSFRGLATAVLDARNRLSAKEKEAQTLRTELTSLDEAKQESESLAATAKALPALRELAGAMSRVTDLEGLRPEALLVEAQAGLDALSAETARLEEQRGAGESALRLARDGHAEALASLNSWREQLLEREEASDEAVCSRCGQPITPEHAHAELEELTARVAETTGLVEEKHVALTEAEAQLKVTSAALTDHQKRLNEVRQDIVRLELETRSLAEARDQLAERRRAFEAVAPIALRQAAGKHDGAGLSKLVATSAGVAEQAEAASTRYQTLLRFQAQLEVVERDRDSARRALDAAELRIAGRLGEVDTAQASHAQALQALEGAQSEHETARDCLEHAGEALRTAEAAWQEGADARAALIATDSHRQIEAQGRRNAAIAIAQALPPELQEPALTDPDATLGQVETSRDALATAPARLAQLRDAEREHAGWQGERRAKQDEVAAVPEAHRVPLVEAQAGLDAALAAVDAARLDALATSNALATLEERLRRKIELEQQAEVAAKRQQRYALLARLLGKTGLQGALVTDALNTITSHANSFLDRLTGGSLRLILNKGSGADELELQAIDTTCMREARDVQALSGSQQFRCAVAIAFGIGQYAGAGGMRSIVIDEGFGSLDETGQQQMVDELKTLEQHMDKVIVVSHLDVFRDRDHFPYQLHVDKRADVSVLRVVA
jgi:DNA repair exonuclease SbcCD ATPase subunit